MGRSYELVTTLRQWQHRHLTNQSTERRKRAICIRWCLQRSVHSDFHPLLVLLQIRVRGKRRVRVCNLGGIYRLWLHNGCLQVWWKYLQLNSRTYKQKENKYIVKATHDSFKWINDLNYFNVIQQNSHYSLRRFENIWENFKVHKKQNLETGGSVKQLVIF